MNSPNLRTVNPRLIIKSCSVCLGLAVWITASSFTSSAATADQPQLKKAYEKWVTTYQEAIEHSQKTGRPIMLVFTGSDWSGRCHKLAHEVFTTHQFARWSSSNVIKLEVDFPQGYSLSESIQSQNENLKARYADYIQSYPTVLFVDADGNVLGKTGYVAGGAEAWIESAKSVVPEKVKNDLLASY